ncbi:hypothetical protein BDV95DRAFT_505462 [Massariosphaeria phaeospora]|uniref:Zn(2)-C6 fungal-type domain-containing protein n=1 Tax=Massariosphaeria phaeospora TaxID=100035 RepID=A0A7C8M0L8_9PLEO|nr:hypothetical protein BDV95DRAFT_505462 [Massariosphaeria phaeospora]
MNLDENENEEESCSRPLNHGSSRAGPSNQEGSSRAASSALSEHSSGDDPDDYKILADDQNPYELRTNIDRQVTSTWVDHDQSGDFDPEEEAKKEATRLRQAKAKKGKAKQPKAPKKRVAKLIVRFRFKAFGNLLNITEGCDNLWPVGWSDVDSQDEHEKPKNLLVYRQNTPDREPQVAIPDPNGEYDDLTGHPIARGCKSCRRFNQQCSTVEGGIVPCTQCTEDEIDCEPIKQAPMTGRCMRCKEIGAEHICSLETADGEGQDVCDDCYNDEADCVPSAPPGHQRIDLDQILYGPDRKWIACTACRQRGARCSLKNKQAKPPCKYCKKNGIGCTFYEITKPEDILKKRRKKKNKGGAEGGADGGAEGTVKMPGDGFFSAEDLADLECDEEEVVSREPTPSIEMTDAAGHFGVIKTIWTSFAHPIAFNISSDNKSACNFCEMPTFSMVGHFEKEVHVLKWYSGLGYTELAAGHRESHGPTAMCEECTFRRLQIIVCASHDMKAYDSRTTQDFDFAAEDLMLAPPRSALMQRQLQRWCSMCFSLATYKCSTTQESLSQPADVQEPAPLDGCGIHLCDNCEERFRLEFNSDSHEMARSLDKEPKARDTDDDLIVVRADVGFLATDGLLMRNMDVAGEHEDQEGF